MKRCMHYVACLLYQRRRVRHDYGYIRFGKSTLLNILGCLDTPTTGEYLLDGISVRTMSKSQRAVLRNRK